MSRKDERNVDLLEAFELEDPFEQDAERDDETMRDLDDDQTGSGGQSKSDIGIVFEVYHILGLPVV